MKPSESVGQQTPRQRVMEIIAHYPETEAISHEAHLSLEVRGKRFGWFLDDHHGDARVALHLKSTAPERNRHMQSHPALVFVPDHVGRFGWLGIWLDTDGSDWHLVEQLLQAAYRATAPKRLVAALD